MVQPKLVICEEKLIETAQESLNSVNLKETAIYIFGSSNPKAKSVDELISGFVSSPSTFK